MSYDEVVLSMLALFVVSVFVGIRAVARWAWRLWHERD